MKKIKIGYFADGPWSYKAFERMIKDHTIEIAFIVPRYDTVDTILKKYATVNNIDYFLLKNVNDIESLSKINKYKCDLLVSMSFNQIFKSEIINLTPLKIINCHAGKLPFYRGRNVINWVLINGDKEFGITVHYVDEGVDTGDIILQKVFPITKIDTYKTLLAVAFEECANILYDSIKIIQMNNVNKIIQSTIHPVGMYCGRRGPGDEIVNWNDTSRNIYNFIRAICRPGPRATTYLEGDIIHINNSRFINEAPNYIGKNGQVLAKTKDGFIIKTQDSFIEILEIEGKIIVGKTFEK
jgi:methionyl-tRNA formyltransferase